MFRKIYHSFSVIIMRVGLGYDIHTFGSSKPLFIGGIEISHPKGFVAHSDGDVLLHALIDALLGAAGLPDIGEQFPDTSPEYKDISSLMLLAYEFFKFVLEFPEVHGLHERHLIIPGASVQYQDACDGRGC